MKSTSMWLALATLVVLCGYLIVFAGDVEPGRERAPSAGAILLSAPVDVDDPALAGPAPSPDEAHQPLSPLDLFQHASDLREIPLPPPEAATPVADSADAAPPTPAAPRSSSLDPEPDRPYHERWAVVTAYCPCWRCCGRHANGRTSTGASAWQRGAATDPRALPYGSRIYVEGYGYTTVDDTGGAMRQTWVRRGMLHIDLRMTYHYQARRWGRRVMRVRIYEDQ